MVIVLSLEESVNQVISGFPEYIILTANQPSTIFYTLDGSTPDENSMIFVDRLTLPTSGTTLTLKALAISGEFSSSILEVTYATDQSKLDKSRHVGKEGINILPPGSTSVNNLSFDEDGNPTQESSILFSELDLRASTTNNIGEEIGGGKTSIEFINFNIKTPNGQETIISSPNDNINFDPTAAYIIIDGSTENNLANQSVRVINRPHGTMDLNSHIHNQNLEAYSLNTSNFVRSMIDPKTGKVTFYYRDSRENRWIKSTQKVEGSSLELSPTAGPPSSFVFRWIEDRAQSRIY